MNLTMTTCNPSFKAYHSKYKIKKTQFYLSYVEILPGSDSSHLQFDRHKHPSCKVLIVNSLIPFSSNKKLHLLKLIIMALRKVPFLRRTMTTLP